MDEILERVIAHGQEFTLPGGGLRLFGDGTDIESSLVVAGPPRVGKTSYLLRGLEDVQQAGVPRNRTLFVDLADMRLNCWDETVLPRLFDAFFRRNPECRTCTSHVFLDNVDVVAGWERSLVRILDVYDVRFVVAGGALSNADAEMLRVRRESRCVELMPKRFSEYMDEAAFNGPGKFEDEISLLKSFLKTGTQTGSWEQDVTGIVQSSAVQALSRGCLRQIDAPDARVAFAFLSYALGKSGEQLSVTKAVRELQAGGITTSRATLSRLLEEFSRIRLMYLVGDYGMADGANHRVPDTVYAADLSLTAAFASGRVDWARRLREAVYLELVAREGAGDVHSLRIGAGERVHFAVGRRDVEDPRHIIHVVDERFDGRALDRACRLLNRGMLVSGTVESTLVTFALEGEYETPAGTVRAVPFARWACRS